MWRRNERFGLIRRASCIDFCGDELKDLESFSEDVILDVDELPSSELVAAAHEAMLVNYKIIGIAV